MRELSRLAFELLALALLIAFVALIMPAERAFASPAQCDTDSACEVFERQKAIGVIRTYTSAKGHIVCVYKSGRKGICRY